MPRPDEEKVKKLEKEDKELLDKKQLEKEDKEFKKQARGALRLLKKRPWYLGKKKKR